MARERVLVNFFYAPPVGHAVEALHYCLGHHAADPEREVAVTLHADTAVRLAEYCPFVSAAYPITHPFRKPGADSARALADVPRDWDWVLDDSRRHQAFQLAEFPGLRDYYAASDAHLVARQGRSVVGATPPGYRPHQALRLTLPEPARAAAARRVDGAGPWLALMPAGAAERALYPSVASWELVLDALREALPGLRVALVGRLQRDRGSSTALDAAELADLLVHDTVALDTFDADLAEQLAVVEACDLFLAPHTGFGLAALAVGTPWLALSGGRWFEYFFNHVPFRSILPDTERYPSFSAFDPLPIDTDGEDGPRTPSMTQARVREDLDRIVAAALELVAGRLEYERALAEYFPALLRAHGGDASALWSIDGVHAAYLV